MTSNNGFVKSLSSEIINILQPSTQDARMELSLARKDKNKKNNVDNNRTGRKRASEDTR